MNWNLALAGFTAALALCLISWAFAELLSRVERKWGRPGLAIAISLMFASAAAVVSGVSQ